MHYCFSLGLLFPLSVYYYIFLFLSHTHHNYFLLYTYSYYILTLTIYLIPTMYLFLSYIILTQNWLFYRLDFFRSDFLAARGFSAASQPLTDSPHPALSLFLYLFYFIFSKYIHYIQLYILYYLISLSFLEEVIPLIK